MHRLDEPRTAAFVHLDGKAHLPPFRRAVADLDRVRFIEPRVRVMWAGFSQVESTLVSLKAAIASTSRACSHLSVISGAEYPLVCNDEILDFFADNPGRQFIRRFAVMDERRSAPDVAAAGSPLPRMGGPLHASAQAALRAGADALPHSAPPAGGYHLRARDRTGSPLRAIAPSMRSGRPRPCGFLPPRLRARRDVPPHAGRELGLCHRGRSDRALLEVHHNQCARHTTATCMPSRPTCRCGRPRWLSWPAAGASSLRGSSSSTASAAAALDRLDAAAEL